MWQISLIAMLGPHFGYKGSLIFKILVLFFELTDPESSEVVFCHTKRGPNFELKWDQIQRELNPYIIIFWIVWK